METVQYVVESVNPASKLAMVLFFNPFHTGEHLEEVEVMTPDGVKTELQDNDPNPHVRKGVVIPFKDGAPDEEAFRQTLDEQAAGVFQRMKQINDEGQASPDESLVMALVGTISAPAQVE